MPEVKLRMVNVVKSFGDTRVLRGTSLSIDEGEMVCLIGASGSGKSTLLRCMNGLTPVDDGQVFLEDIDIAEPGLDLGPVRQRIGMVFQSFNLFPHMSALENVLLAPRRVLNKSRPFACLAKPKAFFSSVDIDDDRTIMFSLLSS